MDDRVYEPVSWAVESIERYSKGGFHPVHYGDVFNHRYKIVRKLGYGKFATVWLARDKKRKGYVALKIGMDISTLSANQGQDSMNVEASVLSSLPTTTSHPGRAYVPLLLDSFVHAGPNGSHPCTVMPVLGESLWTVVVQGPGLCTPNIRRTVRQLTEAVAFLHANGVMHRDIKLDNIAIALEPGNPTVPGSTKLDALPFEAINANCAAETGDKYPASVPLRRRDGKPIDPLAGQPLYVSPAYPIHSKMDLSERDLPFNLALTDYGAAAFLQHANDRKEAYAFALRPPELVLDIPAGASLTPAADVWNLALVVYKIVTGSELWLAWDDGDANLLCNMTARLGSMPELFRARWGELNCDERDQNIYANGKLVGEEEEEEDLELLRTVVLEKRPFAMRGAQTEAFADWMETALKWLPEERATAQQLLEADWLSKDWD